MDLGFILLSRAFITALPCVRSLTRICWTQTQVLDEDKWTIDHYFGKNKQLILINFLSTIPLWEMAFCANLACLFPFLKVPHLTWGNSLACFSCCCEERPRQVQPQRWSISYCWPHCCKWMGLFSERGDHWSKRDALCESCNLFSERSHCWLPDHTCNTGDQHTWIWLLPFKWWFVVWSCCCCRLSP